jgi:hypothetical protein
LLEDLPVAVREQQVRLYQASLSMVAVAAAPRRVVVQPHSLQSRLQVARAFRQHLNDKGWLPGNRIPRNTLVSFKSYAVVECGRCREVALYCTLAQVV